MVWRTPYLCIALVLASVQDILYTTYVDSELFDRVTSKYATLGLFVGSNCSSCEAMESYVNRLLVSPRFKEHNFRYFRVSCDNDKLCSRLRIRSIPTIRLYHKLKSYTFHGRETPEGILDFIHQTMSPEEVVKGKPSVEGDFGAAKKFSPLDKITKLSPEHLILVLILPQKSDASVRKTLVRVWSDQSRFFHKNGGIFLHLHECGADDEFCQELNSASKVSILLFYHGVKVDEFKGQVDNRNLRVYIDQVLIDFPNTNTVGYMPTTKLTDENFESVMTGDYLVLFFAEWCSHCKKYLPEWEDFSVRLKTLEPNVGIGRAECNKNKKLCDKIVSFPTIYFFDSNKKEHVYEGSYRNFGGLVAFVRQHKQHNGADL